MIVCLALYEKADAGEDVQALTEPRGSAAWVTWGESIAQGARGIGPRGAPGGQEARGQRADGHDREGRSERERIVRADVV